MNKIMYGFGFLVLLLFFGCKSDSSSKNGQKKRGELTQAAGGKYYGGIFNVNETEYFRSLYPLNIGEVGGHRISNQIYEGLISLNQKTLEIVPALAERWDITDGATTFTFHLRKDVYFHDDPCFPDGKGRLLTSKDVKYVFDKLCVEAVDNKGFYFIKGRIKGATEYSKAVKAGKKPAGGVPGVQIIDEHTIKIELEKPFSSFLHILAMPFGFIFPPEAHEKYDKDMRIEAVGTGPFYIKTLRENEAVVLLRNQKYWGKDDAGNQLPYLDGLRWSFIGDQKTELLQLKKGKLDFIYRLPLEMADEILDSRTNKLKGEYADYVFQEEPEMSFQYYGFKNMGEIFNDKRLRQAFNYAIDRKKIVDFTLKGAGIPGFHGFVPPAFAGYDYTKIKGYDFQPNKAKQLMSEAGYPNGKGFPTLTLQINSGGTRNEQVAEAIQKMLSNNLNIKINIAKMPFAQHLENIETSKAEFWRAGWIADYPDPENFLTLYWGNHIPETLEENAYLNTPRFKNAKYDEIFEKALATIDEKERYALYQQAEQIAVDEAAVMPIFYDKAQRLLQSYVRNYPQNPMEYRNFREVYFEPTEAYQKLKLK